MDGLHVGGDVREVALVERLLAVRGAEHLHEVAARGVADDADALGIDPVLIGMRAQVAHGGLAVLDERRELDGHGAVFGCGHDETRAGERMAHLDELLVVGGGEASAGEVDHGGLPRLRARRHHRHAQLTDRALGLDLTVDDARYRVDAAVGHVDLHDLGAGHVAHQIGAVGGENRSCREECAGGGNGLEQKGLADVH